MKLTEISVDGGRSCNNLLLTNLSSGLNVVYGRATTGKSRLAACIRNVLFGFEANATIGLGTLEVLIDGVRCQLARPLDARGQLTVAELPGSYSPRPRSESVRFALDQIGPETFDTVFCDVDGGARQSLSAIADVLQRRLNVPAGRIALGNQQQFEGARQSAEQRLRQLDSIASEIASAECQRAAITRQLEQHQASHRARLADLEHRIEQLTRQLESTNPAALQHRIDALDREIPAVRHQLETAEEPVDFVSRPLKGSDGLTVLYKRLDEIDNQIRRWRHVHGDVQQQRVQLKDEMVVWSQLTLDSSGHPYHRTREILGSIEARVGSAENSVADFRHVQAVDAAAQAHHLAQRITDLCGQIRRDLYALCDELGNQYRHVRQRSATAELKRLRRCYDEISQNIDALIEQRQGVIIELRTLDPVGADVIARQDNEFCQCAQHEGYLQARRKYVGEPAVAAMSPFTMQPDTALLRSRLAELQDLRAARVRDLVAAENQLRSIEVQRSTLIAQRQGLAGMSDQSDLQLQLHPINQRLERLNSERQELQRQIDRDREMRLQPANPVLLLVSDFVRRLTGGAIHHAWLGLPEAFGINSSSSPLEAEDGRGIPVLMSHLSADQKQLVTLAVRMAIVDHYRSSGQPFPMILNEVAAGLEAGVARTFWETLVEFCQRGNQVLLLTSDQGLVAAGRGYGVPVFELPETSVTPPVPAWTPDRSEPSFPRQPEFLTPFTTRRHAETATHHSDLEFTTYPLVKYPRTGHQIDHSIENFEVAPESGSMGTPWESSRPREFERYLPPLTTHSELNGLEFLGSADLDRLQRLNVSRIEQLLAINPEELPNRFLDSHISAGLLNQWQSMAWLMVCTPGLESADAQILYAIGIHEPEHLDSGNSRQLLDRIQQYLNSPDGRRFANRHPYFDQERMSHWFESLDRTRSQWRMASGYSRRQRWSPVEPAAHRAPSEVRGFDRSQHRDWRPTTHRADQNVSQLFDPAIGSDGIRRQTDRGDRNASQSVDRPTAAPAESLGYRNPTSRVPVIADHGDRKFFLDLKDQLEAAPSIGPRTAERFTAIGVLTVADFLAQTAESMATKIRYKRITADVIRQWQNQARLVCRVPNLRGHDAQLLVACGIIEPEDLANRQPAKLHTMVDRLADSKEGLKIIRGGKKPDLKEVTDWINWARDTRSLQAA